MVSPHHPLQAPPRPELSDCLLSAVAEQDGCITNRLPQHWVHRHGLASLETWMLGPLRSSQGIKAEAWLRHCLEVSDGEPMAVIEQPLPMVLVSESTDPQCSDPLELPDCPAPVPAALAALRAWLPDRSDDLPLAG